MRKLGFAFLALTIVAAACGDDDGDDLSSGEQAVVDLLVREISSDADPADPFGDEEAARCFAVGMVRDLGLERLAAVGLTADAESPEAAFAIMDEDEVDAVVDAAFACIDVESAIAEQFEGEGLSPDSAECFAAELGETDFYRMAFIAGMAGDGDFDPTQDPEVVSWLIAAAGECLTPAELGDMIGG